MTLRRLSPEQLALLTDAERAAYARHAPDVNDPNDLGCCVGCYDLWPCSLHDAYATIAELRAENEQLRESDRLLRFMRTADAGEQEGAMREILAERAMLLRAIEEQKARALAAGKEEA